MWKGEKEADSVEEKKKAGAEQNPERRERERQGVQVKNSA